MKHSRVFDPAGVVFGVLVPLVAALVGYVLTLLWQQRLPERIATHWGSDGANGYSTPMTSATVFALVILLVGCGATGIAAFAQALLLMRRIMLLIGSIVVGTLVTLEVAMLVRQLDGRVADDFPASMLSWGIGVGLVLGAVGASFLHDYRERTTATAPPAPRLPRGERTTVAVTVGFSVVEFSVVVAILGIGIGVSCYAARAIWPLAVGAPVALIIMGLLRFRVVIDERGVRVGNFGLTSIDIDLAEITGAKVLDVSPFRDFGGWGLRSKGHRRYGIVTKTGPAVEISTASEMTLTITTEHARQMAGALNSWADDRCAS